MNARSSRILLACVFLAIAGIAAYRYQQYVVDKNYLLEVNAPCDVTTHSCFTSDCSPQDDLSCPPGPYEKVEIRKAVAPACLEEHTCTSFACPAGGTCAITYCSSDSLEDGEHCSGNANQ